jgi:hypothetical protein
MKNSITLWCWQRFLLLFLVPLLTFLRCEVAALVCRRHVCLFDQYSAVRGPYFNALFDELFEETGLEEKRLAYCCIEAPPEATLATIKEDLDLAELKVILMDEYDPISLDAELQRANPTIIWMADGNSFGIRYKLRTSGLDRFVSKTCGPSSGSLAKMYIGEGAGAYCASETMSVAHVRGDDPKGAPEPQFNGMGLLGPDRSIFFGESSAVVATHPKTAGIVGSISALTPDEIFALSQSPNDIQCFVMNPSRRGMIGNWCSPPPIPPLVELDAEGVQCDGEPSIDPSRSMQRNGDSEWMEDF